MSDSDIADKAEWEQVSRLIAEGNEQKLKLGKKESGLQYSYIMLDDGKGNKTPYRLGHEILGQGAEGKVKIAEDQNGNKFAVKISSDDKKDNAKETEIALMKEAGATVGDVKVEKDQPKFSKSLNENIQNKRYVLLPFYEGADVDKVLKRNDLSQESKLTLALGCAESISQLHDINILHRDIKGSNFRANVDENGKVKSTNVIDFGGAIKTGVEGKVEANPFGSPGYMSPELGREAILAAGNERVDVRKEISRLTKALRVPEVNAAKAQTLIDQEKTKLATENDPDEKKIISNKIQQYEVKLKEFQDRVDELKGKITIQQAREAGLNNDLDRLFTGTKVVNSKSSDVYAFGKMLEREFKLDLPALGLGNMLAEKPEDRPALSDVQKILKENIAKIQVANKENNQATPVASTESQPVSLADAIKNSNDQQQQAARKTSSVSALIRSKRKITSTSKKQEIEEAKPQVELPQWADNWKKKLGEYDLGDTSARMEELLGKDPSSAARQALYQSAKGKGVIGSEDNKETNSARLEFIEYLGKRFAELKEQKEFKDKPITMEDLIGKKGIERYQAACAEENKTIAFRDAVFISSSQTFDGPKWDKRLMIFVGGPSASGKSFGTEGLINQLNADGDPNSKDKNHVVSIDGGKEREMSQMRQMVLQLALAEGFSGIEDLEKYTKDIKAKSYVQKAVLADGNLNMVTPATFTDPGGKHEKMMEEFAKDPNTKQIFAQVRGVPSTDELDGLDQFKQTVKKMGKRRAFRLELPDGVKNLPLVDLVKPNNRKIGVESKDYDPEIFDFGVKQSNAMREKFEKICEKNGIPVNYFEITNDLIFIKKDSSNNWIKCSADDDFNTPGIKMTNVRAFEAYNKYKPMIPSLDIKDFMPQVYVQYKPDKKQWEEIKIEKDAKPPEGAISISVAGWKIAQNLKAHESPALDKFWKNVLADEVGAKSIVNKGGHPDRPDNQKDKNEEKVNAVGAALRGLGVPLPERAPSIPNLLRGSIKVDKAELSESDANDGVLRRVTGTRKLTTKRRNDSKSVASPDNTAVVVPNAQPVISTTTPQPAVSTTTPLQPEMSAAELTAHFAALVSTGTVPKLPPMPPSVPPMSVRTQVSPGAEKSTSVKLAQTRNLNTKAESPTAIQATQAGIAALNNASVPTVPVAGLNSMMQRKPPKALPKIPQLQNKANAIGEAALEATISKAVLQSADMSRSKRSAIQFNQPGVVDALQKAEEKLNNKPLSAGHRNRAK